MRRRFDCGTYVDRILVARNVFLCFCLSVPRYLYTRSVLPGSVCVLLNVLQTILCTSGSERTSEKAIQRFHSTDSRTFDFARKCHLRVGGPPTQVVAGLPGRERADSIDLHLRKKMKGVSFKRSSSPSMGWNMEINCNGGIS